MKKIFVLTLLALSTITLNSCGDEPTVEPTTDPTVEPTQMPTSQPTPEPTVEPTILPSVESSLPEDIEQFVELIEILKANWYDDIYYGPYYDENALINQFIGAITTSDETTLDPYTYLIKNETVGGGSTSSGKIGITLRNFYSYPVVVEIDKNGAGYGYLQKGDIVVETGKKVNGHTQIFKITDTDYDFTTLFTSALGRPGDSIYVKVARFVEGSLKYFTYNLTLKEASAVPYAKQIDVEYEDTLMVKWDSFVHSNDSYNTASDLEKILKNDNSKNIIIDLRDNGGGALSSAINISDLFLPKGKLITTLQYKDGSKDAFYTNDEEYYDYEKIIILQNENTASASEVFISAMLHYYPEKVYLVGTESYGKGIASLTTEVLGGQYYLQYTCAKWLRPDNSWIGMTDSYYDSAKYDLGFDPSENGEVEYDELLLFMKYYSSGIDYKEDEEFIAYKEDYVALSNAYFFTIFNELYNTDCRVDYYFDEKCSEAIKQFQINKGIENATGIMDLDTYIYFLKDFYDREVSFENEYYERIEYFLK